MEVVNNMPPSWDTLHTRRCILEGTQEGTTCLSRPPVWRSPILKGCLCCTVWMILCEVGSFPKEDQHLPETFPQIPHAIAMKGYPLNFTAASHPMYPLAPQDPGPRTRCSSRGRVLAQGRSSRFRRASGITCERFRGAKVFLCGVGT